MQLPSVVVSDTSPLRALAHLDLLELPATLFDRVYVPQAVWDELLQPRENFTAIDLSGIAAFELRSVSDPAAVSELLLLLDKGEAEALTWLRNWT